MQLSSDIIRHIEGQVMIIVAVRRGNGTAIGRSAGARCRTDGDIELVISAQWTTLTEAAVPGGTLAATFTAPADYRSYQIKGRITAVEPASADTCAAATAYVQDTLRVLVGLGVTLEQVSHAFPLADLMCVRFRPDAVFLQTPGPRAGSPVTDGDE